MKSGLGAALVVTAALAVPCPAGAAGTGSKALPAGFSDTQVAAAVSGPTALAFTPDGRILITRQAGVLRIYQNGSLVATPALTISNICSPFERGLLGVAVDPEFASNQFVYLYYTFRRPDTVCVNRVSRFVLPSGNVISPASETVLVDNMPCPNGNHNAGDVQFGRDGYLYITIGDGGCDWAGGGCAGTNDAARDQHVLTGKVLRVTRDGGIPPDNPFQGAGTARCNVSGMTAAGTRCQETYAWGLRNPFRLAFDSNAAGTRFFINDVGQGLWEEIDEGQAGADYGWNCREGAHVNSSTGQCNPAPPGMVDPIFEYRHGLQIPGTTSPTNCNSITAGAFVPNGLWPGYDGSYLFADYVCGGIFELTESGGTWSASDFNTNLGGSSVTSMTFGPYGNGEALYYVTYGGGGQVRRVSYAAAGNNAPSAVAGASPAYGALPLVVTFSAAGSSDPDAGDTLTYFWNFGDGTAEVSTTALTVQHTYTSAGVFTASLQARDSGFAFSAPATVSVQPGNTPPSASIATPPPGDEFAVGETFLLNGSASDTQDGTLPAASLSWEVLLHHDTHTHPFLGPVAGNDVALTAPAPEDAAAAANSWLEILLTATDSLGLASTVTRNLMPNTVTLSFATDPAGLTVVVNGASLPAPGSIVAWEAWGVPVSAPDQVDGLGQSWTFASWSDGGAAAHTIASPAADATYTATFAFAGCPGDTIAPSVTAPAPLAIPQSTCGPGATAATSPELAAYLAGGSATDACDTAPDALPAQVAGADVLATTLFPIGVTTVTFRFRDANGNIGTATSTVTVSLFYGNLDENGVVDAADLVTLANALVGNVASGTPPFTAPVAAADVDRDSDLDASDLVLLANALVGNVCLPL